MTRYAVGDLQGCLEPLLKLLDEVAFNPKNDQLWAVGDLINRGPQSLETLRFVKELGSSFRFVLGNHDLHFLAVAMGSTHPRRMDTLDEILEAPDRDELIHWLRQGSLIYTDPSGDYSMVHAGIPPQWTLDDAHSYSAEVEQVLKNDALLDYLDNMYGNIPAIWSDDLEGWTRLRTITNYFTRMRFCTTEGELDLENKTNHSDNADFAPWFSHKHRKTKKDRIIFGHWASLEGQADSKRVHALDTGCVWGGSLTLLNLETEKTVCCNCK